MISRTHKPSSNDGAPSPDPRLTLAQSRLLSDCRALGQGGPQPVYLEDPALLRLIGVVERELADGQRIPALPELARPTSDYFDLGLEWFETPLEEGDVVYVFLSAMQSIQGFDVTLACLCELHKRRVKFSRFRETQPLPDINDMASTILMEFGGTPPAEFASWLVWLQRNYYIENRANQVASHLFKTIMAMALGGETFEAGASPIRCAQDASRGRHVGCVVGRRAYAFMYHLTDATSEKGRFREELRFAEDCKASGYEPILLVLEGERCRKAEIMSETFLANGGEALIGREAWEHLAAEAGPTMSRFLDRFIRAPMDTVVTAYESLPDLERANRIDHFDVRIGHGRDRKARRFNREKEGLLH